MIESGQQGTKTQPVTKDVSVKSVQCDETLWIYLWTRQYDLFLLSRIFHTFMKIVWRFFLLFATSDLGILSLWHLPNLKLITFFYIHENSVAFHVHFSISYLGLLSISHFHSNRKLYIFFYIHEILVLFPFLSDLEILILLENRKSWWAR